MENSRIKVKIGGDEFEAEGPQDLVTEQYTAFMAAVAGKPKAAEPPTAHPSTAVAPQPLTEGVPRPILDRVFRQADTLSLAALPNGETGAADALLAILYGYKTLKNEPTVTGTLLKRSAKFSGVPIDRLDRLMAANQPDYVLAAGVKKAKRYQLNNRGIARAEEIIKALIQ